MGYLNSFRSARQRFGELFVTAAQTRQLAQDVAEQLREQRVAEEERHRSTQEQLGQAMLAVHELTRRVETLMAGSNDTQFRHDVIQGLRWIQADEPWHRRHLRQARLTAGYELAYTESEPLISVVIPTYDNLDLLRSRALPSILAQTHRNLEIVIVGDAAEYSEDEVTAGFTDAPIRFVNRGIRGHYPEDPARRWLVAGSPPFNDGVAMARGRWIAPFADDDAMRPNHLSTLLTHAIEQRLEFVYGLLAQHEPDRVVGVFPPRFAEIGLQGALLHSALNIFELELADADFNVPSDWGRVERMLRAGVRVGMVDVIVTDYYPSMRQQAEG